GLELVARQVLGLESERLAQVAIEVGGALAGNAVDEIERDVVESGITESVHGLPDVVRRRLPLEHLEQTRLEALSADGNARHTSSAQEPGHLDADRLGGRLYGHLPGPGKRMEEPLELRRLGKGGRPPAEKPRLDLWRERVAPERELGEQRVDIGAVLAAAPDDGHEVAVPAPVRAERKMHVQVSNVPHSYLRRSASRFR